MEISIIFDISGSSRASISYIFRFFYHLCVEIRLVMGCLLIFQTINPFAISRHFAMHTNLKFEFSLTGINPETRIR